MNQKITFKQTLTTGLFIAGTSILLNVIVFYVFKAAGILTDTIFIQPNQPLAVTQVIISSSIPSLMAPIVFFLFDKFSTSGFRNFSILSIAFVLFSFISPFKAIPNVTVGYAMVLNLMHLVVFGASIFYIYKANNNK
ncbi:MAG: DUF6069 family protein [Bacteroidota bacterium]